MSIYVLRSDNLVKIGFSDNLRNRVQSIVSTVPVPVEFVGHMPGDRDMEKHLHDIFDASHFSGEWFVETPAMTVFFETILIPNMPQIETVKQQKRKAEQSETKSVQERVRQVANARWPLLSKADQVLAIAAALGWTRSRAKDLFYGEPRMVLRAFEQADLDALLSSVEEPA